MLGYLLIIVVLTCTVFAQDPKVTIVETEPETLAMKKMNAIRGKDVTFSCHVEDKKIETYVRWEKTYYDEGVIKTFSISKDQSVNDNTKFGLEKPTLFTWRLRIKAVQLSDIGNYTCFVYAIAQVKTNDVRILQVQIPPQLNSDKTSPDTTVDQGDNIDLSCNATGTPTPSITWSRLGNALLPIGKEKHMESILKILNVQPADRGVYRCKVSNNVGDDIIRDVHLDVKFKPTITADDLVEQAVGYRIELQCLSEANPFPQESEIQWVKDTQTISFTGGNKEVKIIRGAFNRLTYELIIHKVEKEDFGSYLCRIKNAMGTTTKEITLVETNEPQKSVKLGQVIGAGVVIAQSTLLVCACLALHL